MISFARRVGASGWRGDNCLLVGCCRRLFGRGGRAPWRRAGKCWRDLRFGAGGDAKVAVHIHHPLLQESLGLSSPLAFLVSEVLFDAGTHRHGAILHAAVLGVGDAEQDKLPADHALVPLARQHELALPGVRQHPLHLDAAREPALLDSTLCGMHKVLHALLGDHGDALLPWSLMAALFLGLRIPLHLYTQSQHSQSVWMH